MLHFFNKWFKPELHLLLKHGSVFQVLHIYYKCTATSELSVLPAKMLQEAKERHCKAVEEALDSALPMSASPVRLVVKRSLALRESVIAWNEYQLWYCVRFLQTAWAAVVTDVDGTIKEA